MTQYVATINVPGYLPTDDEPAVFATPSAAWDYLADERQRDEDATYEGDGSDGYSDTLSELNRKARTAWNEPKASENIGTIYGGTPGYDGEHDLGLAYSVDYYSEI